MWLPRSRVGEMVNGHSDIGVVAQASPQAAAYKSLLDQLQQVLPPQDFADATEAYKEYADAYAQMVSDPMVRLRATSASQRLTEVLNRALENSEVRGMVQDAAAEYLRLIGEAWPRLTSENPDSEAFAAMATGMTTLAYLYGLGSDGFVDHLGATSPFTPATLEGPWSRHTSSARTAAQGNDSLGETSAGTGRAEDADESSAPDDDGIVWQEFSVGEDGQIVQRAAPSPARGERSGGSRRAGPPADPPPDGGRNGPSASAKTADSARQVRASETRVGGGATSANPVQIVERAYAAYVEGLRLAGARLPKDSDRPAPPRPADEASAGSAQSELDQRATELIGAYLRLAHGIGYAPDPYLSYRRLLATVTELAERQLALIRSYEQLLEKTAQAKQAGNVKQAVDTQYRRFLTTVRTVWSQIDPSSLPPEKLSAMTASTARAADLYQTAINMNGPPFPS